MRSEMRPITLAIDMSNFTDALTQQSVQALKDAGVELAIVQAVDPPAGFPAGRTRDQIAVCQSAGLIVDVYVWMWFDLDVTDIQRKLALISGLSIRQLWLDVEDTAAVKYDQPTCDAKVAAALAECDAFVTTGGARTGVYSGRWFWADPRYMGNSQSFLDRKLWDANYDRVADTAIGFVPYGGWDHCAIKQDWGSTALAGVGGLDLDVLSVEEAQSTQSVAPPDPVDLQAKRIEDLTTALSDVTSSSGEIRMALASASKQTSFLAIRRGLKAIDQRLAALNTQFLGG